MQIATADDIPVFVEPGLEQMMASKSQQDEKDRKIAELEEQKELLAKELEETKSNRIKKLETEIEILQTKETKMNSQYQEHMKDLHTAVQRKHDEIVRLSDKHATEIQAMKDDHSKTIAELYQERKQSEKEKDKEAKKLKQSLHEQEVLYHESEEKIKLLQQESVQLKEELEITLKEQKENEEELCALPANHHLEVIRKEKEELERKHAFELSQLQAALKEKETMEEESKQEADKLRQELRAANEDHAKDLEELHELKQENKRDADILQQELKHTGEKYADEIRQLQAALKEKDKQEETKLRFELEKFAAKHAEEAQMLRAELKEKDEQCNKLIAYLKEENDLEMGKYVETTKADAEKMKHDLCMQHLAVVSKKQKEHDQQLQIKVKEIESLRKQLQLNDRKQTPETVQRLQEQLQEKDHELKAIVTNFKTLQSSYEKLVADHEHLQYQYERLTVELKMKKELSKSDEYCFRSDPSDVTVTEPQVCTCTSMRVCIIILSLYYCTFIKILMAVCMCPIVLLRSCVVNGEAHSRILYFF